MEHTITATRIPWGYNGKRWPKPEAVRIVSTEDARTFADMLPPVHAIGEHDQQHVIRFPNDAEDMHITIAPPLTGN